MLGSGLNISSYDILYEYGILYEGPILRICSNKLKIILCLKIEVFTSENREKSRFNI